MQNIKCIKTTNLKYLLRLKCHNHADEIIHNLWLGDYNASVDNKFLKTKNITYIIRLYHKFEFDPTKLENIQKYHVTKTNLGYKYEINGIIIYHIPIKDSDINDDSAVILFHKTNSIISKCYKSGKILLIHCLRGHHRSASVVAAYMLKNLNNNYDDTLRYIQSIRKCALKKPKCMVSGLEKFYKILITANFFKMGQI